MWFGGQIVQYVVPSSSRWAPSQYTAKLAQKSEQNNLPRFLLFTNLGKMPLKSNRKRFSGCAKNQKKSAEEGVGGEQVRISFPIKAQIPLEILYRGVAGKHHQLEGRNSEKMKGGYRRPSRGVGGYHTPTGDALYLLSAATGAGNLHNIIEGAAYGAAGEWLLLRERANSYPSPGRCRQFSSIPMRSAPGLRWTKFVRWSNRIFSRTPSYFQPLCRKYTTKVFL